MSTTAAMTGFAAAMKPWTPADLRRLRDLLADGASCAAAGEALGRSASACQNKASKLGLRAPADPPMSRATPAERWDAATVRDDETGCLTWVGTRKKDGSCYFVAAGRQHTARKYAWERRHGAGSIPAGLVVRASCNNPACVAVEHLFLGPPAPPTPRGLTADVVVEIRKRKLAGADTVDLAEEFQVSPGRVAKIVKGDAWKNTWPYTPTHPPETPMLPATNGHANGRLSHPHAPPPPADPFNAMLSFLDAFDADQIPQLDAQIAKLEAKLARLRAVRDLLAPETPADFPAPRPAPAAGPRPPAEAAGDPPPVWTKGTDLQRRVLHLLASAGPLPPADVAARLATTEAALAGATGHRWFARPADAGGAYRLSPAGLAAAAVLFPKVAGRPQ